MNLGDILIQKKIIGADEFANVAAQAKESGVSLEKLLEARGVPLEEILKAKGSSLGIPSRKFSKEQIPFDILKQIPEEAVRHYKFVPLGVSGGALEVGMVNPEDIEAREALQFIVAKLGLPFTVFLISENDFEAAVEGYQGLTGEVTKALGDLESALMETGEGSDSDDLMSKDTKFVEEAPVTKIVAVILKHAITGKASDIHIEPFKNKLRVRFRVDGSLYTTLLLPPRIQDAVVSRIKILTDMKLDEKRKPQDGRFSAPIDGKEIDFRVSTFPVSSGEKVVIRVLDKSKNIKGLEAVGMSEEQLKIVRETLKKPYGLILLTGPTGSGKTTTLYGMLQELDREQNNIVSLEDPVEYEVEGVAQSNIRPEIGYTFATGLRSILRQDPDIIMVGEIRDNETATLAVQAALTGHLVFSTLHTNNAAGVIPRLIDMGVEPFLLASTFLVAISQRLVRTLCPDSKSEIAVEGKVKESIENKLKDLPEIARKKLQIPDKVYQGVPSGVCPQGSRGMTGVFEVLQRTPELDQVILKSPVEPEIMKEARRQGMLSIGEECIMKILKGEIGIESINEV